jgi:hypothetical protein
MLHQRSREPITAEVDGKRFDKLPRRGRAFTLTIGPEQEKAVIVLSTDEKTSAEACLELAALK